MREVKREARRRKKAASQPPRPVEAHRAYLAEPARKPPRIRSERWRTVLILVVVAAVIAVLVWYQMSGGGSGL